MGAKEGAGRGWAEVADGPESDGNQGFERITPFGAAALGCGVVPGWESDADADHNDQHDAQAAVFLLRWATALLGFDDQDDFENTFSLLIDTLSDAHQKAQNGELNQPPDPTELAGVIGKQPGKGPIEATSKNPEPIEQEPTEQYQPE